MSARSEAGAMGLVTGEVEEQLRASVRDLLADRAPWTAVLARAEGGEAYDRDLWRALSAGIGSAGLPVPESAGGAGASWREAAVVAEEIGRAVAPVPYLGAALATAALLAARDSDRAGGEELLAGVASGEVTAVLAAPLSTPPDAPVPSVHAGDGAVSGRITSVADVAAADVLVVAASGGLWAVRAGSARLDPVPSLDLTRPLHDVTLDAAPAHRLAGPQAVAQAWAAALRTGAALLAAEQVGVATWCLSSTVGYLKTRYQFGRPVGSYQGLKHRLAELWVELTQARAVARYAAVCVSDGDPDAAVAAALAQAHCAPVAVRAAEECVQMHGGIGFTWEHPAHLYLKRAKSAAIALGTPARHRAVLAGLVDLPPA